MIHLLPMVLLHQPLSLLLQLKKSNHVGDPLFGDWELAIVGLLLHHHLLREGEVREGSSGIRVLEIDYSRLEVERGGGVLERVRVVEGGVEVGRVHRRTRERRVGVRVEIAK